MSIDAFEGPLDVLLRLIERRELDITRVSLALVTDQFLAHIAVLREHSAANLADFAVVAARLLVIKSRCLLPRQRDEAEEEDEEDLGEDLARQLREYKRYKQVATQLREVEEQGLRAFPRLAPPPKMERRLRPGEMAVEELFAALKKVLDSRPPPAPPVDSVVAPVVVHIGECIERLREALSRRPRVRFSTMLRRTRSRLEAVVTFLAVLEMIKQQEIRATQERLFGEVYLERRAPEPEPQPDVATLAISEEVPAD